MNGLGPNPGGPSAFLLAGATPPLPDCLDFSLTDSQLQSRLALSVSIGTLTSDHSRALQVGEAIPLSTVKTGGMAGLQVRCHRQCTPVSHLPDEFTTCPKAQQQDQRSAPLLQPHSPEPFYYEPPFSASRAGSVSGSNSPHLRCLLGGRCPGR